jgi:hypothetical protein
MTDLTHISTSGRRGQVTMTTCMNTGIEWESIDYHLSIESMLKIGRRGQVTMTTYGKDNGI